MGVNHQKAGVMLLVLLTVAGMGSIASRAGAAEPSTADHWNARGVLHRKRLQPEQALEAFRKAHGIEPCPRSRGQMGFVEHDLGRFVDAEQHLSEALAGADDPWVIKNRKHLQEALVLTRRHLGRVIVKGPEGAAVNIEGVPAGRLPLSRPISLPQGETSITVSAPGHLPWEQRLTVTGGKELVLTADLVPDRRELPDVDPSAARPVTPEGKGRELTPDLGRDGRDSPEPTPGSARFSALTRPLAWTSSALAGGALAFAAYESVKWNRKLREFNNHVSTPVAGEPSRRDCGADDEGRGGLSCDAIYRDMDRAKTLALLGYAAGALLAAGAVTLFMISPWSDDADSMVRIACAPASSLSGGTCRFTF